MRLRGVSSRRGAVAAPSFAARTVHARPSRWAWTPLLAVAFAVALAALAGCDQAQPPAFPHQAHLTSAKCGQPGQMPCATCTSCHGGLRTSDAKAVEPPSDCARCHLSPTAGVRAEVARLTGTPRVRQPIAFDHAPHLSLPEIRGECVLCHRGAPQDGAEGELYPPMTQCLGCHRHDDQFSAGQCVLCHLRTDLHSRVPRTVLRHDLQFIRDHRAQATRHSRACGQCHAQAECAACHDDSGPSSIERRRPNAVDREQVHRGDYLSRHGIEVRSTPTTCLRCHSSASCDGCHVARGVSAARVGSTSPHPIGWTGTSPGAAASHGRVARRDLVSCAGCHDQGPATNCIRCHRVGGYGGNPHPSGWRTLRHADQGMCRYCHE
jgi:hypothetical protein